MTFAYIHEFQTCFSQTSCLPSFPSFLYLSFISYLIGFNLLFKESTHSYIYIYISLLGSNPSFQIYISLTWYLYYYIPFSFLISLKYRPFFRSNFFDGIFGISRISIWTFRKFQSSEKESNRGWKKERTRASLDVSSKCWNFSWKIYITLINYLHTRSLVSSHFL